MLARHYAPTARLRLGAREVREGEALLAFGDPLPAHRGVMLNLSPSGDLLEAAANLFAAMRALDASGAKAIAVMPIPDEGLGEAINDRLRRAAASG
jgi:L-threonylcarbamoyladenylate synthase